MYIQASKHQEKNTGIFFLQQEGFIWKMMITRKIYTTSGCPWPSDTVKSPGSPSMSWKSCAKIEIPHPENHILKVFRFRSWKPRVWKSRPQSWDPKSWKPCPENHILKFPRPQSWDPKSWKPCPEKFPRPESWDPKSWKPCPKNHILKFPRSFWVLETQSANSRSPKTEDPTSWKSCPKNFQVWVLETHTVYVPKLKSHILKIMSLKIPCLGFGEPPQCKQTPGGQKLRQLRTPQERAVTGRIFQALPTQTETLLL